MLPRNKEKIKSALQSGQVSAKKQMRVGKNEEFETVLTVFGWFKRM